MRLTDLLHRLRRLRLPPGAPATVLGIPAGGEDLEAEVSVLFGELDAIDAEIDRIEGESREVAARLELDAAAEGQRVLAEAERDGERGWREARVAVLDRGEADARAIARRGERRARVILATGRARRPALVSRAVGDLERVLR